MSLKKLYHKYKAKPIENDGIKFPSLLEARWYQIIKKMKESGEILFFLRQVPFHISSEVTYRADFMLFFTDGHVEIWECKGFDTKEWVTKKKLVEELYPITIKVVR